MTIRNEYAYHQPTDAQMALLTQLREAYSAMALLLEDCAMPSRYRSLASTHLEESAMWANKAVVLGNAGNRG